MVLRSTLRTLAREIAEWLERAVPQGVTVEVIDCGLVVRSSGAGEGRLVDLSPLVTRHDDDSVSIETAALRMLDDVQDEVIETVREAWPTDGTHAAPASAYVEWSDAALSIGYRYDSGRVIASHTVTKTDLRG